MPQSARSPRCTAKIGGPRGGRHRACVCRVGRCELRHVDGESRAACNPLGGRRNRWIEGSPTLCNARGLRFTQVNDDRDFSCQHACGKTGARHRRHGWRRARVLSSGGREFSRPDCWCHRARYDLARCGGSSWRLQAGRIQPRVDVRGRFRLTRLAQKRFTDCTGPQQFRLLAQTPCFVG